MIKIYHNNRCQKSRLAVKLLEKMGCNFEIVNYLKNPITKKTLKTLIKALDMQPIDLVRTNEALWKSEFKGKTLSDDEIINAMLVSPKINRTSYCHKR
jgi:arsenate reductase